MKKVRDTSCYRIETHSKRLQKDLKTIMNHPDLDTNNDLRWNGNLLTNKIRHLESTRDRYKKETLNAKLTNHSEKLGGIWSALSKDSKPRDLI